MFPFEQLEVYKKAMSVNKAVYDFILETELASYLKDQLGRASLSVLLNIAEGSAKISRRDRRNFFVIARGSAFECVSLINFLHEQQAIPGQLYRELYSYYEEISRMLFTMIKNLG